MALWVAAPLAAQGNGTTAGALLELPASARQMAFQGAYAAVVGDEGSVFVNPAGMAPVLQGVVVAWLAARSSGGASSEAGPRWWVMIEPIDG